MSTALSPDTQAAVLRRRASEGADPSTLADVYSDEVNMAIWQRELSAQLEASVVEFLKANPSFRLSLNLSPNNALNSISKALGEAKEYRALAEDLAQLVDMFCCLFDLGSVGLRLTVLDRAMCPKFHVDRVPCRLVTTYQGIATEWLPHNLVDRSKLGKGSLGLSDEESGLYANKNDVRLLTHGDVALLKGESWIGNENAGLVHRSPRVNDGEKRLLLTLDFL